MNNQVFDNLFYTVLEEIIEYFGDSVLNDSTLDIEVIKNLKDGLKKKALKELVQSDDIKQDYFNLFIFLREEVNKLNEERSKM